MRSLLWLPLILISSLTLSAGAREIGVEKPSKEILDGLLKAPSSEEIFISDGHAELILHVSVLGLSHAQADHWREGFSGS
jgi:hypothetical protein